MEQILGCSLTQMCRICLSHDIITTGVFLFSSEAGKELADVLMECAPVHITRHDKLPNYICRLCFTQLKKFHQFQMLVIQSDTKLQRYLQMMNDSLTEIKDEWTLEEPSANSVNQNSKADVTAKCEPVEISDESDLFYTKQELPANFCAENKNYEELYLKLEIKDEPIDDNLLIPTECAEDTVERLPKCEGSEFGCEDSMIVIGDTKVDLDTSEIIEFSLKSEETCNKPLEEANSKLRKNLRKPRSIHTVEKPYQCDVCKMEFSEPHNLKRHHLIHTGEKPYQCDVCKMDFRHSNSLKRHKSKHTGEKPYQCDICKMCFKQTVHLKRHTLKHTQEKPYQCDVCEAGFNEPRNLKRHQLIHTGEKPYQCDICKMCFRHAHTLRNHALKHTGEKPYQCDICKMGFRQAMHLKRHKLIHTEKKPYQCSVCKLGFTESFSLKRHNLIHTGEKPHKCDVCNMSFIQAFQLKSHKLKHTGEKPYQCDICKKCFRHLTTLRSHELKHKGEKPYKCDICKMCFRQAIHLKRHKIKQHTK